MADISIQIKGELKSASLAGNDISYQIGDVIAVYERSAVTESPSTNSSLVFVHITGAPDVALSNWVMLMFPEYGALGADNRQPILKIRKWFFDQVIADPVAVDVLRTNREITITWDRVKQLLKRKDNGSFITDADLTG